MKRSIGTNNTIILLRAMMCVLFVLSFASMSYGGKEAYYGMPSSKIVQQNIYFSCTITTLKSMVQMVPASIMIYCRPSLIMVSQS